MPLSELLQALSEDAARRRFATILAVFVLGLAMLGGAFIDADLNKTAREPFKCFAEPNHDLPAGVEIIAYPPSLVDHHSGVQVVCPR